MNIEHSVLYAIDSLKITPFEVQHLLGSRSLVYGSCEKVII